MSELHSHSSIAARMAVHASLLNTSKSILWDLIKLYRILYILLIENFVLGILHITENLY